MSDEQTSLDRTAGPWCLNGPDYFGDYTVSPSTEALAIAAIVQNGMRPKEETAANAAYIVKAVNAYPGALAEIERLKATASVGYLYFNPDTGTEFAENHPIESGECDDAENVRAATAEVLSAELKDAWQLMAEETAEHGNLAADLRNNIQRLEAKVRDLEARARLSEVGKP